MLERMAAKQQGTAPGDKVRAVKAAHVEAVERQEALRQERLQRIRAQKEDDEFKLQVMDAPQPVMRACAAAAYRVFERSLDDWRSAARGPTAHSQDRLCCIVWGVYIWFRMRGRWRSRGDVGYLMRVG